MTTYIIISLCVLTLLAYIFDLSGKRTRVPGVILLMLLGIIVRQAAELFTFAIPNLRPALPVIGTVGLILIVLEGSLDLELRREKLPLIGRTLFAAIVLLVLCSLAFAALFTVLFGSPWLPSLVNAIPLGIISSAIAISGVFHLAPERREFVVYESTFSDIIGILFFNFLVMNEEYGITTIAGFVVQIGSVLLISAAASFGLGMLLQRITHHVKVIPIIAILLLLYSIAKKMDLPSLVLVMAFGLFLNNLRLLDLHWSPVRIIRGLIDPSRIAGELVPFKHLVAEVTFVVRSFFFIMFGYYTDVRSLADPSSLMVAFTIAGFVLVTRALYFRITRIDAGAVLFVAPRGLITILLFLSIPASMRIPGINEGLLTQVIFISAFVMMAGLMNESGPDRRFAVSHST
ncbi:MAG: sodium:proton antiporter [Bacteroidetes bacterium]|nr:sodium:proton antiporter [Bacteroidota bacterium]